MKIVAKLQYLLLCGGFVLSIVTLGVSHRLTTICSSRDGRPSTEQTTGNVGNQSGTAVVDPVQSHLENLSALRNQDRQWRCDDEYERVTAGTLPGLTQVDLERSLAYRGNHQRLIKLVTKLSSRTEAVTAVACGGSITLGHGTQPIDARYSGKLQDWFNKEFPLVQESKETLRQHIVYNRGSHGADICAMAKRMNFLKVPTVPDLFVLEFAVNDYQGQDHVKFLDEKEDVFFDGFERIASCAEAVVYRILNDYPDAAVIFLEFQTANLNRRTAQLLHMGVAQHYKVPVVSYGDVIAPDLSRLFELLEPFEYRIPTNISFDPAVLPYPHGCAPCRLEDMEPIFHRIGCWTLCDFAKNAGYYSDRCRTAQENREPCHVPLFDHDEVHPSVVGHRIAADLIANLLAKTALRLCRHHDVTLDDEHMLPTHAGWLVGGRNYRKVLRARTDFVMVNDTMAIFEEPNMLQPKSKTAGFNFVTDKNYRAGWIADNVTGGESIAFEIDLPVTDCYVVYLSVLKSYATVGTFTVTVEDTLRKTTTSTATFDCLWKPRISVPNDVQITSDKSNECTGKCIVAVTTNPEVPDGRKGNLIKIISLAVRKCDMDG